MPINPAAPQPVNINPYNLVSSSPIGIAYISGVGTVVNATLAATPNLSILQNNVDNYIQSTYFTGSPPQDQQYKLNATVGQCYNAYIQPNHTLDKFYSPAQLALIELILDRTVTMRITPNLSYQNIIQELEKTIAESGLSDQEAAPLFMTTAIAWNAFTTLYNICLIPTTGTWSLLIEDTYTVVNIINFPRWLRDICIGALIGYSLSKPLVPATATDGYGVGENFYTVVACAIVMTVGTMVFQWEENAVPGSSGCGCGKKK